MEVGKRIPRKRLRITRSLGLEQRNVLRLRASFGTRLGIVHWLFNRLAPALDGTQRGRVTSNELSRSMESHLLRNLRRRGRCIDRERYLKSGGGRKLLRSQLRNYFSKHRLRTA